MTNSQSVEQDGIVAGNIFATAKMDRGGVVSLGVPDITVSLSEPSVLMMTSTN